MINRFLKPIMLALFGLIVSQNANAIPTTAWTVDNPLNFRNDAWSFGDIFTVGGSDIVVTGLGAFDANLDGFITNGGIEVGIFRESDGALLTSTFVQSTDTLIGNYRFTDITDLTLSANTTYRVVANNRDDLYNIQTGTPNNVDSRITWDGYGYCRTTSLLSCDSFSSTERTWMANFQLDDVAQVPEPTALALMSLGLVGFGFSRKRKKA